jgi:hypothetical protein
MRPEQSRFSKQMPATRFVLSALLALLVAGLQSLAISQPLHQWLHSDAGDPGHQCAVTFFAQNPIQTSASAVAVPAPSLQAVDLPAAVLILSSASFDYRWSPSRAPPVVLS